ncbi:CheR family methyltransferase [Lacrimispora amygdalina]
MSDYAAFGVLQTPKIGIIMKGENMVTITDKEFNQLSEYIKSNYGIFLKKEKKTLVLGRLHTVLDNKQFNNFSDYFKYIISDNSGDAATTLLNHITTNHTFFMREAIHFDYFRDKVLPYLANTVNKKDLRIWCAACSSGEEAYTLAMVIDEFFGEKKQGWDTKVLATDISERILNIAKKGIYSSERIAPLPSQWKINYFKKYDTNNYILTDKIRSEVIYRKFNLKETAFPFKRRFHVIFCRNVMIYFDEQTKRELVNKFYDIIEDGGYLFIGHSEALCMEDTRFKYIMPSIYRKE